MNRCSLLAILTMLSCSTHTKPVETNSTLSAANFSPNPTCKPTANFTLVIHGGAGDTTPEERALRAPVMQALLIKGHTMLKSGATALNVVEMAVKAMEDSGAFNAGRGGISNKVGDVELDASIMDGSNRKAGSIAGVQMIKNPITAARTVMDQSENVMFVGTGAEIFAKTHGVKTVNKNYFINRKKVVPQTPQKKQKPHGTVGAVALDQCGHLAAGTSTAGWEEKIPGRVGDSPIIGAGTFASDDSCAVSATGHGEFFIRWSVAHTIAAKVEYQGLSVEKAASQVIETLRQVKGEGGVIALDSKGNFTLPYNSLSMSRGYIKSNGEMGIAFDKWLPNTRSTSSLSQPIKVACIGDSITAGPKNDFYSSYPILLAKLLGIYDVKNFGVGSSGILESGSKPYIKQSAFQEALSFQPDIVLFQLGTNDSFPKNWVRKSEFESDAKKILSTVQTKLPRSKIFVILPAPVFGNKSLGIQGETLKNEIVPILKKVAYEMKLKTIDINSILENSPDFFPDQIHPNSAGAAKIAEAVYQVIMSN